MPADPRQTARLRKLHQDFAWKVNAAVAAGRHDLIDSLCEEYAEEAVRLLTGAAPSDAGLAPPPAPPQRGWRCLLGSPRSRRRSP
jgi:hypothetical protein